MAGMIGCQINSRDIRQKLCTYSMELYNALSQTIEQYKPADPTTLYVCGITPYDTTHLGHAFTYTVFDILIRYLEFLEYPVRYVQNVTDIDDDILRKANEADEDWQALGDRWTRHFIEDLRDLNMRPPDFYPRATDVISDIVSAVERLLDAGVAYVAAGNVYFHIDAWPDFGKLSHIPRHEMLPIANERGNSPDDPHKQDPLDFILWQAQKPGEPAWESPWGLGRPGWHIECSTMSTDLLGETIDIHGGGGDLVFPHHECEIAQIEPVSGRTFVRFWMHVAMVHHEGEKMSKSLGNLVMARDLLKVYSADAIRLYLATHHYRTSWSFDEERLAHAAVLAENLRRAGALKGGSIATPARLQRLFEKAEINFIRAMENDLNTAIAVGALEDLATALEDGDRNGYAIEQAQAMLRRFAGILGLRLNAEKPETRVIEGWHQHIERFQA